MSQRSLQMMQYLTADNINNRNNTSRTRTRESVRARTRPAGVNGESLLDPSLYLEDRYQFTYNTDREK